MRKYLFAICLLMPILANGQELTVLSDGLKFCEGSVPYKNTVLVSNFGSDKLDPLNQKGNGYIASIHDDQIETIIPAAGYLSAPKGMAVLDNHLFVADVGRVAVFNLKKPLDRPRFIKLAHDDLFTNDVVVMGELILVSVTNTGRIYAIDASDINAIGPANQVGSIAGANGMVVAGTSLYVASYNPSGIPDAKNIIYVCDVTDPKLNIRPLFDNMPCGQYDGIAINADGNRLYFTSWTGEKGATIYSYALSGKEPIRTMDFGVHFSGPADISIIGDVIYIPDLPESKIYRLNL